MKNGFIGNTAAILVLSLIFGMLALGCTSPSLRKGSAGKPGSSAVAAGPVHRYYEFSDVLIPGDLKLVPNSSSIYQSPGHSAGIMVLDGYVDAKSLASFFESNMAKDNWTYLSSIKFNPYLMLFEKENRACVIRIEESSFKTKVEIWVGPTPGEKILN